ncbi:SMP-30/gluconolactonase/LRE family protein [uncultured Roseibium sp.]|uniref:SMP-30/gluconolactonase/LRE family protein n=1 Tax=uncultured Roseibium sp. TaxID=1936171 RepID=UPI0032165579
MSYTVTRLIDPTYQLAECPTWDDKTGRLLWADIQGQTIQSMDWATKSITSWQFENEVGSFGLADDGRLVVSVWDKVILFDPDSGERTVLAEIETDLPQTRLNDGKVGPDGAFWVGTMDTSNPREPIAGFYRVDAGGDVWQIRDGLKVSNGLAWSPDGTLMYHSDSSPGWIEAYVFDPATGSLGAKMLFAQQTDETGRPDGATVDAQGNYWSAGVSAGVLNCFSPDGDLKHAIPMPCPKPTMPCFCGPDLDQLVVTSLKASPEIDDGVSGGLYLVEGHGLKGLPAARFRTADT